MTIYRVGMRMSAQGASQIALREFVPVFHRYIQRQVVVGPLVDVANYEHVSRGPGVVLVAFDANYSIDVSDGALGLVWYRKRPSGLSLEATLVDGAKRMVGLCAELEAAPEFRGRLRFLGNALRIFSNDRLLAPNAESTAEEWYPALRGFARVFWGEGGTVTIQREAASLRERFAVVLHSDANPSAQDLWCRLPPNEETQVEG